MKRSSTGSAAVAVLLVLGVAAALSNLLQPSPPPSILLVTIDTLRADHLGCYGYGKARTPVLDGLAAEGALFEDAATASPLTLPSHATILSGLLPPRHGLRDNDTPRPLAPADRRTWRTVAERLREAGWQTGAFLSGSPLSPRWGLDAGFDTYDPAPEGEAGVLRLGEREGSETAGKALAWLGKRDRKRPFLLWVHLFDPHHPYAAPGGAGHPPDSVEAYDEEVAHADRQVGRLLSLLREEGTLDRTVVMVCSDHGEGLGEHGESTHGYFLHRSTTRVPLLLRAPGRVEAGLRIPVPVSLADVAPTLLDIARHPSPAPLDGLSLLPLLSRRPAAAPPPPSVQYAETLYGWRAFRWAQSVAVRNGTRRILDHGGGRRRVHDLASDPGETRDLSASPPAPGDEEAAAKAWELFRSPPLSPPTGPAAGEDPSLAAIGYITGYSPVSILGAEENGSLPLPSLSFLKRFESVQRMLERAAGEVPGEEASHLLREARALLEQLDRDEPGNPALAFWMGRAFRQEARQSTQGALNPWKDAFKWFLEAGKRGYREPRTVNLLLESAFQAGQHREMLTAARLAVEGGMEGDASFHVWVALAWYHGARGADGRPTAEGRTRALGYLDEALRRARTEEERVRIREVRAFVESGR